MCNVQPVHCTEAELQLKRGPASVQDSSPGHVTTCDNFVPGTGASIYQPDCAGHRVTHHGRDAVG